MQEQTIATSYASILGQMIRQLREQYALDQKSLADHIGVSVMTISRIEAGDTVLDVPQMEKVAIFFKIEPVEFFRTSLIAKTSAEKENFRVFQNKKEFNQHPNMAIMSAASVLAIIAAVLNGKK